MIEGKWKIGKRRKGKWKKGNRNALGKKETGTQLENCLITMFVCIRHRYSHRLLQGF